MHYKLLALDLDGTLLDSASQISSGNLAAVRRLQREGVRVIVTTGRSYASAEGYIRALDVRDPTITYNGALIQNGVSVLKRFTLEGEAVRGVLGLLREKGYSPIVYTADERKYYERADRYNMDFFSFSSGTEKRLIQVPDLMECEWDGVLRVSVITGAGHIPVLHSAVAERFGARVKTVDTFFPDWDFWIFEVLNSTCSKSKALDFVCGMFGIAKEEVVAIGDNDNDIDMIAWAGLGVAMRNALPPVREASDYITENTNDGDGVAEAIERFFLGSS